MSLILFAIFKCSLVFSALFKYDRNIMNTKTKKILITSAVVVAAIGILLTVILVSLYFTTQVDFSEIIEVPIYTLDGKYTTVAYKVDSYSGHPDLVCTGDGELITMFPEGHGKGAIITETSSDFGRTWERRTDTPESWRTSQETPTLYRLSLKDGSHKIILTSGCPLWPHDPEYEINGFNFAYSDNDGKNWSEFENFYGKSWASQTGKQPFDCIVAMSSLTQLKENGEFIDKWMGTFHDHNFDNYRTYLTFDGNGRAQWSEPELLLGEWNSVGQKENMCEIEIVRAQTTDELILIARTNVHTGPSVACVSSDEGKTWTKPAELPYALTGDRHKAEYDETTGKWLVSFRQVLPFKPNAVSVSKISGEGWVGWVGSDEVLLALAKGDKSKGCGDALIVLGKDYKGNLDCGYSGTVVKDGTFTVISYGYFSKGVKYPYILSATFRLDEVLPVI